MVILGLERMDQFHEMAAAHERGEIPPPIMWGSVSDSVRPQPGTSGSTHRIHVGEAPLRIARGRQELGCGTGGARPSDAGLLGAFRPQSGGGGTVLDAFTRSPLDTERSLPNMCGGDLLVGSLSDGQVGYNRPFPAPVSIGPLSAACTCVAGQRIRGATSRACAATMPPRWWPPIWGWKPGGIRRRLSATGQLNEVAAIPGGRVRRTTGLIAQNPTTLGIVSGSSRGSRTDDRTSPRRDEWIFFGILSQADRTLAVAWWGVIVLRGILPALLAVAIGTLVGAVQRGDDPVAPLVLLAAVFVPLQVLSPIHRAIGANLGSRAAAWLYDRLTIACVRPPGMGHLENPRLTSDLTMARDFDLGITGPPMTISMDFIGAGLVELVAGLASALVLAGYAWWAPLLLAGAWLATHWLLREAAVWRDRNTEEVRERTAPRRLRLPTGSRTARRQGASAVRARGLDCGPIPVAATSFVRAEMASNPAARAAACVESDAGACRQHRGVLVDRHRRSRRRTRTRSGGDVCECGRDNQLDSLRRIVVGASMEPPHRSLRPCGWNRRWHLPVRWNAAPSQRTVCRRGRFAFAT